MHATEYLAECQIERAQAALASRGFMIGVLIMRVAFVFVRSMPTRVAAGVPRGMHKRPLLRNQQQEHA